MGDKRKEKGQGRRKEEMWSVVFHLVNVTLIHNTVINF
jgi:hypothetical protein